MDNSAAFHRLLTQPATWSRLRMAVARRLEDGRLQVGVIHHHQPLTVDLHDDRLAYGDADDLIGDGWRLSGWHGREHLG
jgi:hypothetical protein